MIPEEVWQVAIAMATAEGDANDDAFAGLATEKLWVERATIAVRTMRELGWRAE